MGNVTAILNKIMEFGRKVIDYFKGLPRENLIVLAAIAAGFVVLIVIGCAMLRARRRRKLYYGGGCRRRSRRERRADRYYLPRKRRVRYVKTKARKNTKVQRVYGKADQSTILATGIFGVSLGIMAHRALMDEKRDFYL